MGFYKPNAILTFNDGVTDLTLAVCMKLKKEVTTINEPGLQNVRLFYLGNAVTPRLFPESVKEGSKALVNIDSGTTLGDFIFYTIQRTRFKSVEKSLGQTFMGYVIPRKVSNDSDWT